MTIRKVFFSFAYSDVMRAMQVRKSNMVRTCGHVASKDKIEHEYYDAAAIEKVRLRQETAIKNWIDKQMLGTSVTCVLIGTHTHKRRWVRYEIEQSLKRGKGLVGIHVNGLNALNERAKSLGRDPLVCVRQSHGNDRAKTYDWVGEEGFNNLGIWIETAWIQVRG